MQVSIQLKLNEKVKNSFEYCEVHLPFFHRFVMFLWFKTMNNNNCVFCNDKKMVFIENNDARLILRKILTGQRHDRVQTESQQLQPWTAVSTLLGLVITV